jgi:hypothetical protein
MVDRYSDIAEPKLLFSKEEWGAAMPELTADMTDYLKQYRTPVFLDRGDHGEHSGSFIEVGNRRFVLTNEHIAQAKRAGDQLGVRFHEQDQLLRIAGDHIELPWPWDLAPLPITDEVWTGLPHGSSAIQIDQIATAHTPFPTEVFAFAGYAGERTTFVFGTMQFGATTSLAREVDIEPHAEIDSRFHLGLVYLPDRATTVVGDRGLPKPPGLSGSTVWNTCFVEAKAAGLQWAPELAKVAGVVWGWPSGQGVIAATKAEHVRSFLLGALRILT